jgi:hypothetical protein
MPPVGGTRRTIVNELARVPRAALRGRPARPVLRITPTIPIPQTAVVLESAHAGRAARGLPRALAAMERVGLPVLERIPVTDIERLQPWIAQPAEARPLIVAAGGDGTVGAAADAVAGSGAVLGILPLGTSNDVARSLRVPLRIDAAASLPWTWAGSARPMRHRATSSMPPHSAST